MEKIVKGQPYNIEFGDYGNCGQMIPVAILKHQPNEYFKICIQWQYPNSDRTIELWDTNDSLVDFDSFKA